MVVTGCSTGIGWGTAKVLLGKGYCVFGSVRKAADAARVQAELGPGFTPLLFDITDESAVTKAASQARVSHLSARTIWHRKHLVHQAQSAVHAEGFTDAACRWQSNLNGRTLFGLVNNAGVSCPGPLLYMPLSEFQQNMDINVLGTLIVTRVCPLLALLLLLKQHCTAFQISFTAAARKVMPLVLQAFVPLLGADKARGGARPRPRHHDVVDHGQGNATLPGRLRGVQARPGGRLQRPEGGAHGLRHRRHRHRHALATPVRSCMRPH